tara:strand:- start:16503 stop:16913 length:411 start_codon:yes stop_codon:yes gene_type:complete
MLDAESRGHAARAARIEAGAPEFDTDAFNLDADAFKLSADACTADAGAREPVGLEARQLEVTRLKKCLSMQHARLDVLPWLLHEYLQNRVTHGECKEFLRIAIQNEQELCTMYMQQITSLHCMPNMKGCGDCQNYV